VLGRGVEDGVDAVRERVVVEGHRVGVHDEHLTDGVGAEPLLEEVLRTHRLRVVRELGVTGERAVEQRARRREPEDQGDDPHDEGARGVARTRRRQRLRGETTEHGRDPSRVEGERRAVRS
jgi:hypothetical protein